MMKPRSYAPLAAAIALASGAVLAQGDRDRDTQLRVEADKPTDERIGDERDHGSDLGDLADRRVELTQMADETIEQLREDDPSAAEALDSAHGYAVFDTTKAGLIVTGAGGTGVAQANGAGDETYMHMGAAGVGLGAGIENYKLVLVFEDDEAYDAFVTGQWDGGASAQAAAGEEGAAAEEQVADGVEAFRITDAGLIAQVDVTGMRFWPSDRLNGDEHEG